MSFFWKYSLKDNSNFSEKKIIIWFSEVSIVFLAVTNFVFREENGALLSSFRDKKALKRIG